MRHLDTAINTPACGRSSFATTDPTAETSAIPRPPHQPLTTLSQVRPRQFDDLQRSVRETIVASGWASKYWPCLGAIMQIAVYPDNAEGVAPDDYPYIIDFEPKKREMFEAITAGSEYLSGTADKKSVTNGSTSVTGMEYSGSAGFSIGRSAPARLSHER